VTTPFPMQITFRHMDTSPALEERIRELAGQLARHSSHIVGCHVVIEPPSGHHHTAPFGVTLAISVPGNDVTIRMQPGAEPTHDDPYTAVADAFKAAARRLDDYEARRHHDVKSHSLPK
jgi:ribosome-associated translation inhibitor RaiA